MCCAHFLAGSWATGALPDQIESGAFSGNRMLPAQSVWNALKRMELESRLKPAVWVVGFDTSRVEFLRCKRGPLQSTKLAEASGTKALAERAKRDRIDCQQVGARQG